MHSDLQHEHDAFRLQLGTIDLTDEQVICIEEFWSEVRDGFDYATFQDTQRYYELLEVQGTLADENDERVVYISCRLG